MGCLLRVSPLFSYHVFVAVGCRLLGLVRCDSLSRRGWGIMLGGVGYCFPGEWHPDFYCVDPVG